MKFLKFLFISGLFLPGLAMASPDDKIRALPGQLAAASGIPEAELKDWFAGVKYQPRIIDAITRPSEALPWYKYKKIFLNEKRIQGGVKFWRKHKAALDRAYERYGVPPEMIVAIIGVETQYGGNKGSWSVLDALATLSVGYPRRAKFFRGELVELLKLSREENISPKSLKSSYAGALGLPQFMPSSYRAYAVDFDADGHRDLLDNENDAIGSVANYFEKSGWRKSGPVVAPARVNSDNAKKLANSRRKPGPTLRQLAGQGVKVETSETSNTPAMLLSFEEQSGPAYFTGFQNFYVITRYNTSRNYAMAAWLLSQELRKRVGNEYVRQNNRSAIADRATR